MALWSRAQKPSVTTFHHPILGEVTLNRSARARRVSLSVRGSGEVRLTLPLRGDEAEARRFLDSRVAWIVSARERVARRAELAPKPLEKPQIERFRAKASEYLPRRVAQLASGFGFKYGRVTVRYARSRWGSCSSRNDLSLNLMLMQLPEHLIDFIILHELCHTVHHNHSAAFHQLLNRCTNGRERELIKELKGWRI